MPLDSFAGDGSGDEGESDLGDTCYEANEQENAYLFKNGNIGELPICSTCSIFTS